jgi:hypothetical protein
VGCVSELPVPAARPSSCSLGYWHVASVRRASCFVTESTTHVHRGGAACSNAIHLPRKVVQDVLIEAIREDLADPALTR